MNYYYVKVWQTYVDYCGKMYIVTEVSKDKVVLVDENSYIYILDRLEFISECMGSYYFRIKSYEKFYRLAYY